MTRYTLNKVLWQYTREPEFRAAVDADTAAALAGRELDADERAALEAHDLRAIFVRGAHPFLVYSYAIALNGGWSFDMMQDYVARLQGLESSDIET